MAQKKQGELIFTYDSKGDVLDISIGKPKSAISEEIADDFYVRIDEKTKDIVGFMILNFNKQFKQKRTSVFPLSANFEFVKKS